jgi:hypothetical protein
MEKIMKLVIRKSAQLSVVAFFTFIYSTPLFILFKLIIFRDLQISDTVTFKYYVVTYFTMFISYYKWILDSFKKDKKNENKNNLQ